MKKQVSSNKGHQDPQEPAIENKGPMSEDDNQDQDPGMRQKQNQADKKDDPLAA